MKKTTFYGICYFLLLIPFFKSPYFGATAPLINNVYNVCQIISAIIISFLILRKKKVSKIIIYITLFEAVIILSTIINDGSLKSTILDAIQAIVLCMIVDYGIQYNKQALLKGILFIFELLITINALTIFIYPNGMYINPTNGFSENWFLGFDNSHIVYLLIGITISVIYSYLYFKKLTIRTYYLIIISFITIISRWTATGVIGLSLLILYLLLKSAINKFKFFNIRNYTLIAFGSFLGIIVFRIQNYFSYLIVDVLKKDLTFTNRTYIWDRTIHFMKQSPYLGCGYLDGAIRQYKYHIWGAVHAHNQVLEVLYLGGTILAIILVLIIILMIRSLNQYRTYKITKFISWIIFIFMIMMLTEVYEFEKLFLLTTLACNIKFLLKE